MSKRLIKTCILTSLSTFWGRFQRKKASRSWWFVLYSLFYQIISRDFHSRNMINLIFQTSKQPDTFQQVNKLPYSRHMENIYAETEKQAASRSLWFVLYSLFYQMISRDFHSRNMINLIFQTSKQPDTFQQVNKLPYSRHMENIYAETEKQAVSKGNIGKDKMMILQDYETM